MKILQYIISILLLFLSLNVQGINYSIQDLGTLATDESFAACINNQNAILGYSKANDEIKNFIWEPSKGFIDLPISSYKTGLLNNHNDIASIFWHRTNYWFQSNARSKHLFIYQHSNGLIRDLVYPKNWKIQELADWQKSSGWDKDELAILAFNDNQQMLVANHSDANKATQFAIWQNEAFKELDASTIKIAYDMNNQGRILGRKWLQNGSVPMLVLYNPLDGSFVEIMKDINLLVWKLNDLGQVIILQCKGQTAKGFLWDPSKGLIELEDFAPIAFNNCNQIIGYKISEMTNKKLIPLMWNQDEIISLSQFIGFNNPESIWSELSCLHGINDNGFIIGRALFDGKKHAFVLVPTTAPGENETDELEHSLGSEATTE